MSLNNFETSSLYNRKVKHTNLLIITHHFSPEVNGTATRVFEIVKKIIGSKANLRVFVISPPPTRPFGKFAFEHKIFYKISLFNDKVNVIRVWSYQPRSSNPNMFERILNYTLFPIISLPIIIGVNLICDRVIIVTPPSPICLSAILSKIMRKKVIVDVTDLWYEEAIYLGYVRIGFLAAISRGLELLSLKTADLITVATHSIVKFYKSIFNEKEFYVFPTLIDESLLCKTSFSEQRKTECFTVVYAGNFGKPQELSFAIEAFSILNKNSNNVRLLLIGGGEEEEKLRSLINSLKLSNVKLVPTIPREELFKKVYPYSTLGLVALSFNKSLFYALPTKVYEYLACGLPFVSYGNSKELKYLTLRFKCGIHIEYPNSLELAKAILYIVNHRDEFLLNVKKYIHIHKLQAESVLKLVLD
jgi:colanic acid biosynthesis glycosyl transferase WcaI